MSKRKTSKAIWCLVLGTVALSLMLILLGASGVLAQGPEGEGSGGKDDGPSAGEVGTAGWAGAWDREVGVEYVANYPYCCRNGNCGWSVCDLPCAANNAWGFYNTLRGYWPARACTVGHCFIWGNANAWEQDFKRHALGGTNNNWVDDVDIVFYEGHGNPSLFTFETPWGHGTHDDSYLTYNDAYQAWGDNDLEWIALLSCSVLADSHEGDWSWAMNNLHLLMGFKTTAYDVCGFGQRFAQKIVAGYSIKNAWFIACDQKQPSGVVAKVLAEEYHHFYDSWYYQYPDHPADATYWRAWKSCGSSQPPLQVNPQQVGGVMPVFTTPALSLDEQQAEWSTLTRAFKVPTQTVSLLQEGDYWVSISGTQELEMDTNGLFYYIDHSNLFSPTTSSQVHILTAEDAKDIADQFLTDSDLMPGDAKHSETTTVNLEGMQAPGRALGQSLGPAQVLTETITDYQVVYSRILTYTTTVVQGDTTVQQVNEFSVVGPGSKLKVYVSPTGGQATVATNGGPGAVVGAQGGWRSITETVTVQEVEPILPYEPQIVHLFDELEPQVALEHVPFQAADASKEVLTYTLGYWEESTGQGQDKLYPAYILQVRYEGTITPTNGVMETLVVTGYTYIPANETYMRPLAMIESHSDLSGTLWPGQVITFTAADATQTLADLGYHESLTFTLGSGGPYFYNWYLGSVAEENRIGGGGPDPHLVYTVTVPSEAGHEVPVPQTVILQVMDMATPHSAQNSSTASEQFNVTGALFMPVVLKGY